MEYACVIAFSYRIVTQDFCRWKSSMEAKKKKKENSSFLKPISSSLASDMKDAGNLERFCWVPFSLPYSKSTNAFCFIFNV